jgi:hypothetical protein
VIEEDPDYKAFLEDLMRPAEYLPSAEVQYDERKKEEVQLKLITRLLLFFVVFILLSF